MKIIDSNLLIYSASEEYSYLRMLLRNSDVYISTFSKVEVLGYHKITQNDKIYFEALFRRLSQISISDEILNKAIELRQIKRMSSGDAIIAATAIVNNATLFTRNVNDFDFITNINIENPCSETK